MGIHTQLARDNFVNVINAAFLLYFGFIPLYFYWANSADLQGPLQKH